MSRLGLPLLRFWAALAAIVFAFTGWHALNSDEGTVIFYQRYTGLTIKDRWHGDRWFEQVESTCTCPSHGLAYMALHIWPCTALLHCVCAAACCMMAEPLHCSLRSRVRAVLLYR